METKFGLKNRTKGVFLLIISRLFISIMNICLLILQIILIIPMLISKKYYIKMANTLHNGLTKELDKI